MGDVTLSIAVDSSKGEAGVQTLRQRFDELRASAKDALDAISAVEDGVSSAFSGISSAHDAAAASIASISQKSADAFGQSASSISSGAATIASSGVQAMRQIARAAQEASDQEIAASKRADDADMDRLRNMVRRSSELRAIRQESVSAPTTATTFSGVDIGAIQSRFDADGARQVEEATKAVALAQQKAAITAVEQDQALGRLLAQMGLLEKEEVALISATDRMNSALASGKISVDGYITASSMLEKSQKSQQVLSVSATTAMQNQIAALTGVGSASKSAADSAQVFSKALGDNRADIDDFSKKSSELRVRMGENSNEIESSIGKIRAANAGFLREIIVIGHEVVSGNFSRIPGSFMVLAERAGNLHGIVSALATPTGLASVAIVALGTAATVAALHVEHLNQSMAKISASLAVTGSAISFQSGAWKGYIDQLSRLPGIDGEAAQSIAADWARIGGIVPSQVQAMIDSITGYVMLTGKDAPEAAKHLADVMRDPIKGLDDFAQKTGANVSATRALVEEELRAGEVTKARQTAIDGISAASLKAADDQTEFQKATLRASNALHDLGDAFSGSEKDGRTLTVVVSAVASVIEALKIPIAIVGGALRDLVYIGDAVFHSMLVLFQSLIAVATPVTTAMVDLVRATAAASTGELSKAQQILSDIPNRMVDSYTQATGKIREHINEIGKDIQGINAFRLPEEKVEHKKEKLPSDTSASDALILARDAADIRKEESATTDKIAENTRKINTLMADTEARLQRINELKKQGAQDNDPAVVAEQAIISENTSSAGRLQKENNDLQAPKKTKGESSHLQQWQAELEAMKLAHTGTMEEMTVKEEAFWREKAQLAAKGSSEQVAAERNADKAAQEIRKQSLQAVLANMEQQRQEARRGSDERIAIAEAEVQVLKNSANVTASQIAEAERRVTEAKREQAEIRKQIAQQEASAVIQLEKIRIAEQRDTLNAEVEMGRVSSAEKFSMLREMADREYQIDLDTLGKKLDATKGDAVAQAQTQREILVLSENYNRQLNKLDIQQAREHQQAIHEWVAPIGSAMNSMIAGYMQGTMTMRQLTARAGQAIVISYAQSAAGAAGKWLETHVLMEAWDKLFGAKQVVQAGVTEAKKTQVKIAGGAAQTGAEVSSQAAQTGAVLAGGQAQVAAQTASAEEGLLVKGMTAIKSIAIDAYTAAAGAYSAIASIPYVGPFLAPVVAAGALAAVFAFGRSIFSAEGGIDKVPHDGAMFELHKDEMVLPAYLANPLRNMVSKPSVDANQMPNMVTKSPVMDAGLMPRDLSAKPPAIDSAGIHPAIMNFLQNQGQAAPQASNGNDTHHHYSPTINLSVTNNGNQPITSADVARHLNTELRNGNRDLIKQLRKLG